MTSWSARLLDFLLPRFCCVCGKRLAVEEQFVCTRCLMTLPYTGFMTNPYDNDMAKRFWGRIAHFEKAAALFFYEHSDQRNILFDLKYRDQPDLGLWLGYVAGKEMVKTGFAADIDCLMPIPLARKRLRERGYNQSEMIARGISQATELPLLTDVVSRNSFKKSQTQLDNLARYENVKDTFTPLHAEKATRRHVLIVDDVVTTGATMTACAEQLKAIDGVRISVFSLAFVRHRHSQPSFSDTQQGEDNGIWRSEDNSGGRQSNDTSDERQNKDYNDEDAIMYHS